MIQSERMVNGHRKRKRKTQKRLPLRNADAQIFIDRVKFQRKQEAELEAMDKSFDATDSVDSQLNRLLAGI